MAGIKTKNNPIVQKIPEITSEVKKDLLVGSIFSKDDVLQRKWLDLQLEFLNKNTQSFDHVCVLYSEQKSEHFDSKTETFNIKPFTSNENSKAHVFGLNQLAEIFRSKRQMYNNFLFLDSDAFPVRSDWQLVLNEKMHDYSMALALRTEDLETRLHASILYAKKQSLENLSFVITNSGLDLLGCPETDICVKTSEDHKSFPLIRSNRLNLHPALCGIYYDCFYHHCCGSGRAYNLRSKDYWDIMCEKDIDVSDYTEKLMCDPVLFVNKLRGI